MCADRPLDERYDLSEQMLFALNGGSWSGLRGRPEGWELVEALQKQLRIELHAEAGQVVLLDMIEPLDVVLSEGPPPIIEDRGARVVSEALYGYSLNELAAALFAFGWRHREVPRTSVADLDARLKAVLAQSLTPFVTRMLQRWTKRKYLKQRRRGAPAHVHHLGGLSL